MAVPLRGARNRRVSLLQGGYHQHLRLTRTRPSPLSLSLVLGATRPLGSLRSTTEAGFNGAVGASSAPELCPLGALLTPGNGVLHDHLYCQMADQPSRLLPRFPLEPQPPHP